MSINLNSSKKLADKCKNGTPCTEPRVISQASANLLAPVPLAEFYRITLNGDYAARGVGMRNRGFGTIDFDGDIPVDSTIIKAFLYWAVMPPNDAPVAATGEINGTQITGTLIASPVSPCWGPDLINVYRADVTNLVFPTTTVYNLTNFPSGVTDSTPPQDNQTPPLLEGATLVVIYQNNALQTKTIIINDGGETNTTADATFSTTLSNFTAVAPVNAKTTYIVADGQLITPGDNAIFNGTNVAGPGTAIKPEDAFDGADGNTIPGYERDGLWDTLTLNVSSLINPGDTSATAGIFAQFDCLTYIAQVLSVSAASLSPRGIDFRSINPIK